MWVNQVWALAQAHQHPHDTGVLTDKDLSLALEINALALVTLN